MRGSFGEIPRPPRNRLAEPIKASSGKDVYFAARSFADVDENDIGQIKRGQGVRFTVQAYPDRVFDGTVRQVRLQQAYFMLQAADMRGRLRHFFQQAAAG